MLINQAMQRLQEGPDVISGIQAQGLRNINEGSNLSQQALENRLTSRGLGGTAVEGAGLSDIETRRFGEQSRFLNEAIPALERQFQSQDLADALAVFGYRLPGSTSESTFEQDIEGRTATGSTDTRITAGSQDDFEDRLEFVNQNPNLFQNPPLPGTTLGPDLPPGLLPPPSGSTDVALPPGGLPEGSGAFSAPPRIDLFNPVNTPRSALSGGATGATVGGLAGGVGGGLLGGAALGATLGPIGAAAGAGIGAATSLFGRGRREADAIVPAQNYVTGEAERLNEELWQRYHSGTLSPEEVRDAQGYLQGIYEQFLSETREFGRAGPGARESLAWIEQLINDWNTIPVGGG